VVSKESETRKLKIQNHKEMKTKQIIAAALLIFAATFAQANAPRTLTFKDTFGRSFSMPMKAEQAIDPAPAAGEFNFQQALQKETNEVFDISSLRKPEPDANDIPFDLNKIYQQIK